MWDKKPEPGTTMAYLPSFPPLFYLCSLVMIPRPRCHCVHTYPSIESEVVPYTAQWNTLFAPNDDKQVCP